MVYVITYDLNNPGQKYDKLHESIVNVSNNKFIHVLKSTYIIKSFKSSKEIYEYLTSALDGNDGLFISEVTQNYYGQLRTEDWPVVKGLF